MTALWIAWTMALSLHQAAASPAQTVSPRPAPTAAAVGRPGSLELSATTSTGVRIANATVAVEGPVSRRGTTDASGGLMLVNLPAATYRCRIEHDGYVTLEKEVVVRAGTRTSAEAMLNAAPAPPPPPPPPAPAPAPDARAAGPKLVAGEVRIVSATDLAEQMLKDRRPAVEQVIGCSGASLSRLLLARETLTAPANPDADEMLYVVAGEASLAIDGKTQAVSAGWFGVTPRGSTRTLTKQGRGPAVIALSIVSGTPCAGK